MAVKVTVYGEAKLEQIQRAQTELKKLEEQARIAQGGFSGSMLKMGNSLQEWGGKMTSLGSTMTTHVTLPIVAAGAGLYKLTEAAAEDAKAQDVLANTLRNTAGATDAVVASTEEWISAQGKALGVADDQLRPALGVLAGATGDVAKAQELAGLAMDIAAAKGISVETAANGLAKAYAGNLGALNRLVPGLDQAAVKSGDFAQVQAALADMVGGSAATAADTQAGAMQRSKIAMEEAGEEIGTAFLPILLQVTTIITDKVVPAIQRLASWFSGLSEGTRTMIVVGAGLVAAIGPLAWVIGQVTTAVGGLIKILPLLGKALTLGLGPIGWIITGVAALTAGLIWFFTQTEVGKQAWASFVSFLGTVWESMKAGWQAVVSTFQNLMQWFVNLPTMLVEIFTTAPEWLAAAGQAILQGLWDGIKLVFKGLEFWFIDLPVHIISFFLSAGRWLYDNGDDIIRGLWEGIKLGWTIVAGWFRSLPSMIGAFFLAAGQWLLQAGKTILQGMKTGILLAWQLIKEWFASFPDPILAFFKGAGQWLLETGKNILQGLWDGLQAGWKAVSDWVSEKVNWIKNKFKDALKIKSPSQVFFEYGEMIGQGLALGLQSMESVVGRAAVGLAEAASTSAQNTLSLATDSSSPLASPMPSFAMAGAGSSNVSNVTIAPGAVQITFEGSTDAGSAQQVVEDAFAKLIRELRAS